MILSAIGYSLILDGSDFARVLVALAFFTIVDDQSQLDLGPVMEPV